VKEGVKGEKGKGVKEKKKDFRPNLFSYCLSTFSPFPLLNL